MRRIRLRAWDVESECYIDEKDWAGITPEGQNIWIIEEEEASVLPILGEFIIEQYTGLKDKNGKMIFEGDLVSIQGVKYYVDFEHGGFWFSNDHRKWKTYRPFTHFVEINDIEVIGNIHENSELLEGK